MNQVLRAALIASIAGFVTSAAVADVSVSLQPAATHAVPNQLLNIYVYIDSAGSPFNAYETVIRWNPEILEFVSAQPDTLYGDHNWDWWMPEAGPDSILISHVILQGGLTVTGPGALSSITLRALQIGQSPVYFDYIEFYRFGFDVLPVWSHDAIVYVEDPSSGASDPRDGGWRGGSILVTPNPIDDESVLILPHPVDSGALLRLFDIDGRLLREHRIGSPSIRCRLTTAVDVPSLAAGSYFLEILAGADRMRGRFIRLRR
jgi:hypothetical protein